MTEEGKPRKKRRIVLKIFLILLALAVLLVAGGYTYWAVRGSRVDLPYGLKAGMSLEEIRKVMADSGFTEVSAESRPGHWNERETGGKTERRYVETRDILQYGNREIFGVMPEGTELEKRETSIELSWRFKDTTNKKAGSLERSMSDDFRRIRDALTERYGAPTGSDMGGGYMRYDWGGIHWDMDVYRIALFYFKSDGFDLYYRWDKTGIF